ncbi:hypothetical protein [Lutibacter citreus]|uniref:hypothetical protein n=1 Tax=Lutibacter citreus TaxID=2138210 RepID=UPI000DBE0FCC|nr:hypothetical protein [Lutibacter citreus]
MKIEHLEERIKDYKTSIKTVIEKKILWETKTRDLLLKTLNNIVNQYNIGWRVQELSWINSNEAVNITFDSFPPDLIESTNKIPSYQFIQGGALVFSQSYSGDINVFMLFPVPENMIDGEDDTNLAIFTPENITEKVIIEKVDEFLKKMVEWEVPAIKKKVGYIK